MKLLERNHFLDELAAVVANLAGGKGRTVLITGEAGIGKTSLVEEFVDAQKAGVNIYIGACDALFTPRPLGPLYDIAQQIRGELLQLLRAESPRAAIFNALLEMLQESALPNIVIFEDIHWADEATLDLIKFIARRISRTDSLLLLTYRDDEIGRDHPLRLTLADIPAAAITRLKLPRLSEAAVARLAQTRQLSPERIYLITGGNPFFVRELLDNPSQHIPDTIRDAVLARFARLDPAAREILELVSVVPARTERWLLAECAGDVSPALDVCLQQGMLREDRDSVAFRHELARMAIEDSLSAAKRQGLHAGILQTLRKRGAASVGIARLVHHATQAGDEAAVQAYAPEAGKQAATLGAHREAAAHFKIALRYADSQPPETRADLLEAMSYECYLTDQLEAAFESRLKVHEIRKALQQREKEGESLRWLSRLAWFLGRRSEADRYAAAAIEILETLPPGPELAMAYSNLAQLHMLADNFEEAVKWGNKAIDMATAFNAPNILAHALNNVGAVQMKYIHDGQGEAKLLQSLQISLENGFEEHAARAYTNLSSLAVELQRYDKASAYLEDGIGYSIERDLDSWKLYMQGWLERLYFELGQWEQAGEIAHAILSTYRVSPITRVVALAYLGWLRVRRGDAEALPVLDEALALAQKTGELQRIAPVAAARAEAAWLSNDRQRCIHEARSAYALALEHRHPWWTGALALWLWRAGKLTAQPAIIAEPYRQQISGDWRKAAAHWEQIGNRYECALALADGDASAKFSALEILREIGANPAVERLEQQLRAEGVRGIPRGPRASTRENPAGLTIRQMEVLSLLAKGLQNKEIAEQLFISPKTVDHHISAILAKLNVSSRSKAVTAAAELGLISLQ